MVEELSKRLASYRKEKGFSQEELANQMGIKRTTLSSYEQGLAIPPIPVLRKYSEIFDETLDAIITGKNQSVVSGIPKVLAITVNDDNEENIELVNQKASAGYVRGYADPEFVRELPKFRLPFLNNGTYRAFEIEGDSMLPIPPGAVIIGKYVERPENIKAHKTYIFVTINNGIIFKRVADINDERIILKSDNPVYLSYSLPVSEVCELWESRLYISSDFSTPEIKIESIESRIRQLQEELDDLKHVRKRKA